MEAAEEKRISALNDLIIINNDRYEGYRKAAEETKDESLKDLFKQYSRQSDGYNRELRALVPAHEDEPDQGETTLSGKLYRVWMDVKTSLAGNDRKAVLSACEFGEDVALGTYKDALDDELSGDTRTIVLKQREEIRQAHNHIKALRDQED